MCTAVGMDHVDHQNFGVVMHGITGPGCFLHNLLSHYIKRCGKITWHVQCMPSDHFTKYHNSVFERWHHTELDYVSNTLEEPASSIFRVEA